MGFLKTNTFLSPASLETQRPQRKKPNLESFVLTPNIFSSLRALRPLREIIVLWFLFLISTLLFFASCAAPPGLPERGAAIAVWPIEDLSPATGSRPDPGEILADQVIDTLKKRGDYVVVERKRLALALEELRLGTTALADEATRLRLGKIIGARWMIFGGYLVVGDQMRLDLRLVQVETGKVTKAVQKTTTSRDMMEWMAVARRAAEELF
jgi:TolB-like protein